MPVAVWVMSYVPPLDQGSASPLPHNAGFFLGAFFAIGMALGKLGRMMVEETIGDDPGIRGFRSLPSEAVAAIDRLK